ncbi:MAG: hypothetical protein V7752_16915 [Halopseudomonas sp.]
MDRSIQAGCLLLLALGFSGSVAAHAFGQRYELPVPLWLYLVGAAATVVLSFVVMAFFVREPAAKVTKRRYNLLNLVLFRLLAHRYSLALLRLLSVALFVLVLLTGFYGFPVTQYNFAPAFVWVIWWVGFAYISALVGDLWALLNPWKIIFNWAAGVHRWFFPGRCLGTGWSYPKWLGVFPAIALFMAFAWLEHAYPDNAEPEVVAAAALTYGGITWIGMLLFGGDRWLKNGEIFTVLFSLFARFSPTEMRVKQGALCTDCSQSANQTEGTSVGCPACFSQAKPELRELNLRPLASGLVSDQPLSSSMVVLVMLLLSTLALDGFLETPLAASLFDGWNSAGSLKPLLAALGAQGGGEVVVFVTLALLIAPVLFVTVYLSFSWLMQRTVSRGSQTKQYSVWYLARLFALSLLPIAIAYHLAHYLSFLLLQGQSIIALASDPFGLDWDLFGTAYHRINIGIVDARFSWYTAVIAIVSGHVIAVYLAHRAAVAAFSDSRQAIRSQYPMLGLMVGYTMLSLWILAQPIVGF